MSLQNLLLDEWSITYFAFEWLFAGMHTDVSLQCAIAREPRRKPWLCFVIEAKDHKYACNTELTICDSTDILGRSFWPYDLVRGWLACRVWQKSLDISSIWKSSSRHFRPVQIHSAEQKFEKLLSSSQIWRMVCVDWYFLDSTT